MPRAYRSPTRDAVAATMDVNLISITPKQSVAEQDAAPQRPGQLGVQHLATGPGHDQGLLEAEGVDEEGDQRTGVVTAQRRPDGGRGHDADHRWRGWLPATGAR